MSVLSDLQKELRRAEEIEKLLGEVWYWYGPYGPPAQQKQMPEELHQKLRVHFAFDDDE